MTHLEEEKFKFLWLSFEWRRGTGDNGTGEVKRGTLFLRALLWGRIF
jgi:hypothetical protein